MRRVRRLERSPLIVFDLDGTLVDSRRDIADATNALLVACGADALPEPEVGRMIGDGAATLVARAFLAAGQPEPPDALARFLDFYDRRLLDHTRPYPQIPEVLEALAARRLLALLTNKPLQATRRILAGLHLARFFDAGAVVGGDGPFARKPDAAGLRHLMARATRAPEETILVGDSLIDWRTGRNAAVRVCLVRYGFGFDSVPADLIDPETLVVDQPRGLLAL